MKLEKACRRQQKINKRKNGMRVDNKSIFTLEEVKRNKALEIKKKREEKEKQLEET